MDTGQWMELIVTKVTQEAQHSAVKIRIYLYPPVAKSPRIPMKLVKLSKTMLGEPV